MLNHGAIFVINELQKRKKYKKGEKEMRNIKRTAAILMLTAFIFATAMPAMAVQSDWTVYGIWDYQVELDPQKVYVDGYYYIYSSAESGTIQLNMTETSSGVECFDSYDYSGKVTDQVSGADPESDNYKVGCTKELGGAEYKPGESFNLDAENIVVRTKDVKKRFILTQNEADKMEGTVELTVQGQTVKGKVTATKRAISDWKLAGKWDYQVEFEEQRIAIDEETTITYSSSESGTMQLDMTETKSGVECFNNYTYSGKGVHHIDGNSEDYTVEPLTKELRNIKYSSGHQFNLDAGDITIGGFPTKKSFVLTQNEANKMEGTVELRIEGVQMPAIRGKLTATRRDIPQPKSSGSGGCNAGFGALALLALAGLVWRKRS